MHSILYWVNKDDPQGSPPADPSQDSQFPYWEYAVSKWFTTVYQPAHPDFKESANAAVPTATDDIHVPANFPQVSIVSPSAASAVSANSLLSVQLQKTGRYPAQKTDVYLNGKFIMTAANDPLSFSFNPADIGGLQPVNTLAVTLYDSVYDRAQATTTFTIAQ